MSNLKLIGPARVFVGTDPGIEVGTVVSFGTEGPDEDVRVVKTVALSSTIKTRLTRSQNQAFRRIFGLPLRNRLKRRKHRKKVK